MDYERTVNAIEQEAQKEKPESVIVATQAKQIADSLKTEQLRAQLGSQTSLIASISSLLSYPSLSVSAQTELLRITGNLCFDQDDNRARVHHAGLPTRILDVVKVVLGPVAPQSGGVNDTDGMDTGEQGAAGAAMMGGERERSLSEMKLLRACIGALLNMSLTFDPIRAELSNPFTLNLLLAILDSSPPSPKRKVEPVYQVYSWAYGPPGRAGSEENAIWKEKVMMSATIVGWTLDILEDLLASDKASFPPSSLVPLLSPLLTPPPSTASLPATWSPELSESDISSLFSTDLHLLSTSASLFESLSLDLSSIKQEIAFASYTTSSSLLESLYDFIETSNVPSFWRMVGDTEEADDDEEGEGSKLQLETNGKEMDVMAGRKKAFETLKSAVIKAVVESPNDDLVMDRLFKEKDQNGNPNLTRLKRWLEMGEDGREDLLICSTHMLAGLGRKDENCIEMVHKYELVAPLARIFSSRVHQQFSNPRGGRPGEVTQILFGVVSLLRHLSIPVVNKAPLGETGIIEDMALLLRRELDMVGPLQNAVIGLLKHLTAGNVANSLRFVGSSPSITPNQSPPIPAPSATADNIAKLSPLDAVLALISRTDDIRLRSEATRTLVNVVRAFFSTRSSSGSDNLVASPITPSTSAQHHAQVGVEDVLKRRGKPKVVTKEVIEALSEMIRLSEKYPMLINEGIVGLTLLAGSGAIGALLVLEAIILPHAPPPSNTPSSASSAMSTSSAGTPAPTRTTSLAVTASGDPPCSSDMLATWIGIASAGKLSSATATGNVVRPEMVVNVCALLITVLRGGEVGKADRDKLDELGAKIIGPLNGAAEAKLESEALKKTIARALEVVERR